MRAGSHRQAGPDLRAILVTPGSTLSRRMLMLSHFHLYGELRFPGVMERRNGPSGLREDDDDAASTKWQSNTVCIKTLMDTVWCPWQKGNRDNHLHTASNVTIQQDCYWKLPAAYSHWSFKLRIAAVRCTFINHLYIINISRSQTAYLTNSKYTVLLLLYI